MSEHPYIHEDWQVSIRHTFGICTPISTASPGWKALRDTPPALSDPLSLNERRAFTSRSELNATETAALRALGFAFWDEPRLQAERILKRTEDELKIFLRKHPRIRDPQVFVRLSEAYVDHLVEGRQPSEAVMGERLLGLFESGL